MIPFKCKVTDTLSFVELLPFQGNLKERTEAEIQTLANSLTKGLIQPFSIWGTPDGLYYIIDGHARYAAIQKIAESDPPVLKQDYPVSIVYADTMEEACELLLQTASSYGKVTAKGFKEFSVRVPNIKVETLGLKIKVPKVQQAAKPKQADDKVLIKMRVPAAVVTELIATISSVKGVEIL